MLAILLFIEMIILLITGISMFLLNQQIKRNIIIFWTILSSLLINTFSLLIALFMNLHYYEFFLIIDGNVLFITEFILLGGMFYALLSKNKSKINFNPIHDGISLLVLAGIIGFVSSSHFLILISWFAFVLVLFGINLFYEEITIDFKNLVPYFLIIGISLAALYIFSIIIFLDTGTINLIEIISVGISNEFNLISIILIIIGFGLPCGIFPIGIFHLKKIFQDGSYFSLLFYMLINYSIIFNLFRSFQFFKFIPLTIGLYVTIISILGTIIFSYVALKQLFFSFEEKFLSLKKIMGYSMSGDFNGFLMLFSISLLIPGYMKEIYLNGLFLVFSLFVLVKLLILTNLYPMILTHEDDQIVKGKGRGYSKLLRYLLYFAGAKIAFPLSFYSSWILFEVLSSVEVQSNSAFIFFIMLIIILNLFYNAISLLTISTINLETHNDEILNANKKELELYVISFESKIVIIFIYSICILINILFFLNLFSYILL